MDLESRVLGKELQRDEAAQLDVLRIVDHTHAANVWFEADAAAGLAAAV